MLEGVGLADVTRTGCGRSCIDCLEQAFEVRERREWIFGVLPHARSAVEPAPGGDVGDGVGFADNIGPAFEVFVQDLVVALRLPQIPVHRLVEVPGRRELEVPYLASVDAGVGTGGECKGNHEGS